MQLYRRQFQTLNQKLNLIKTHAIVKCFQYCRCRYLVINSSDYALKGTEFLFSAQTCSVGLREIALREMSPQSYFVNKQI